MSAHSCAAGFVYISAWLRTFSLDLNFAFLVNTLFPRMGNNKPIDKRVVQKVFETSAAGESRSTVGAFFHRSRRWAQHALRNYSSESFSPISVNNC